MMRARTDRRGGSAPQRHPWLGLGLSLLVACSGGDDKTPPKDTSPDGPQPITDTWSQELISPVDILWVVDGGWSEGLDALDRDLENDVFELLLLADPSWKMGLTDATQMGSKFGVISPQWTTWPGPDPFETPQQSDKPRIREAIHMALELRKDTPPNSEFIRSDAHLYVVVFTNSEDKSEDPTGETTTGTPSSAISESDFVKWFGDFQPSDSKRLSVVTDSSKVEYWSEKVLGGGIVTEVGSFRTALRTIVLDAMGQKTVFTLTTVPAEPPEVASVTYREKRTDYALGQDFDYDPIANTISFIDVIPPRDSVISVTYLADDAAAATTPSTPSTTSSGG